MHLILIVQIQSTSHPCDITMSYISPLWCNKNLYLILTAQLGSTSHPYSTIWVCSYTFQHLHLSCLFPYVCCRPEFLSWFGDLLHSSFLFPNMLQAPPQNTLSTTCEKASPPTFTASSSSSSAFHGSQTSIFIVRINVQYFGGHALYPKVLSSSAAPCGQN